MNMKQLSIVTALGLILLTPFAWAASLPDYYPQSFRLSGTLQRIDASRNIVVIADTLMQIPANLKVHTLHTEFGTINSLRPGMKVGAVLSMTRHGKPMVNEIWVLPDDYQQHFH